jgi:hypothetical protein
MVKKRAAFWICLAKLYEAIVQGDADSTRFDLLIHMPNETKYDAKYASLTHVADHGCSKLHETDKS